MSFCSLYIPVGVPTYHLETAKDQFDRSCRMLRSVDPDIVCPDEMLLTLDKLRAFLDGANPDLVVFQNLTFANAAMMSEVLRRFDCPVLLWTLREPVIDGGRLRLNSLTGAYSAANTLQAFGGRSFNWCFGAPEEESVISAVKATIAAARVKKAMRSLTMAAIGHTPQGFGFGRALDGELMHTFGVELESIEARELIDMAKAYSDEECAEYLRQTESCTCGLDATPEKNRVDHARLLKAYTDYVGSHHIGALASRCWPDFFTSFGTPVCTVLSMLNDRGVAAACEADIYGALSMWIGMQLSGEPVFFGDPVAMDEAESSITYWHCGAASLTGTAARLPAALPGRIPALWSACIRTARSAPPWTSAVKRSPRPLYSGSAGKLTAASASSLRKARFWTSRSSSSAPPSWSGRKRTAAKSSRRASVPDLNLTLSWSKAAMPKP